MRQLHERVIKSMCTRPRLMSGRRGFSLIEVLIAVVVLALGLLGVGAVFPVVIRSQRQSQDVIMGKVASRAATAYILGRKDLVASLRELAYDSMDNNKPEDPPVYEASPWHTWKSSGGTLDPATGLIELPNPDPDFSTTKIYIPVADRLFPSADTENLDPQYVWDIALRRKKEGGAQVVVFTRRIDSQIAIRDDITLSDALLRRFSGEERLPVAVGAGDDSGIPSNTGRGAYSFIRRVEMVNWGGDLTDGERDRSLIMVGATTDETDASTRFAVYRRAEIVGQRLVDNLGNTYTVTGTITAQASADDGGKATWIQVDPPISYKLIRQQLDGAKIELLMTPQVPAAVSVIDIE